MTVPSASASESRQTRTYDRATSIVFLKTRERYGGLSNMAGGFPLRVNGLRILTSEALYQACRFPHRPDLQRMIIEQRSPMTAKMKSKPHRHETRRNWNRVRVAIMRWCLRVKLAQNAAAFRDLLLSTGGLAIVEESRKDVFWGAKPIDEKKLVGVNALGRLLMELRELVKREPQDNLLCVERPSIPCLLLDGRPVERIVAGWVGAGRRREAVPRAGAAGLRHVDSSASWPLLEPAMPVGSSPVRPNSREYGTAEDRTSWPPYAAYKDSGVEWLGKVPAHWEILRLKAWLDVNQMVLPEDTDPDYTFDYVDIGSVETGRLSGRPERSRFGDSPSRARRVVRPGDTIVSTVRTYLKAVWHAEHSRADLIASTGFAVLTPRRGTFPKFGSYFFQSDPFTDRVTAESVGIAYPAIAETRLGTLKVCVPPLSEQTAIVCFLDHADRRIQRYIRAKRKLIALLEEQKQAIIHQAVTGQIDVRTGEPYSAYKPSGVEWLGDVPDRWDVVPLRRVTLGCCDGPFGSGLKSSHYTEKGVRVVRLQNIGHGEFKDSDVAFISPEHYSSLGDHSVEAGDVLIAGLGDRNHPSGRACVAPAGIIPAMVKADCFRFRLNQEQIQPRFAALQLTATAPVASAVLSTGATRQRTNLQATSGRAVGVPSVPEQHSIVEYLTAPVCDISRIRVAVQQEIDLLRDYRARLITDTVTGKLDVRTAAAQLADHDAHNHTEETSDERTIDQEMTV